MGTWLDPISKLCELYCVASFYTFMVDVLTPDQSSQKDFFIAAERRDRRGTKQAHDRGSLR